MLNTTKVLAVSALAGLLIEPPAWAQDPEQLAKVPPSVRAGVQTDYMVEKLHLSPEERTQVEAINLKFANQMQSVLEGSTGMFARMREAKSIEAAKDAEMQKVLSPEQYQGYLGSKSELKDRLKQKAMENAQASKQN